MRIIVSHDSRRLRRSGYALFLVLLFTGVVLTLFASMMAWTASNAKVTRRNNLYVQSQAAAESAVEVVLATMMRDFLLGDLNASSAYTSLSLVQSNWPAQFVIKNSSAGSANSVTLNIAPTNWTDLPFQYTGLQGLGQDCTITAWAAASNQLYDVSAPITQKIWFGTIPIFQFAIFYNIDLEINPGKVMNINGKVHSNQGIYSTGSSATEPLTFSDIVEAVGTVSMAPSPRDPQNTGRSGHVIFSLTANNPSANVNSLNLPIGGTNRDPVVIRSLLDLPPPAYAAPDLAAYSSPGQVYPFNEADLIISNAPTGTNITIYYQNGNMNPPLLQIPFDKTNFSGTNIIARYWSFVTNVTFYDFREYSTVKAVQIDVARLRSWITNGVTGKVYDDYNYTNSLSAKGHHINSIYVNNTIAFSQGTPSTDGTLPAVRMVNGERLPTNGLTVATSRPIYVEGNYNVTRDGVRYALTLGSTTNSQTWPAAFLADAITVISTNWDDTLFIKGRALGLRQPSDVTVNAACFEGIVQSDGANYSGGVENFIRMMEDWSNGKSSGNQATLTYNGSIVVMFPSRYADSPWQPTGTANGHNLYNAPNRKWGFDTSFYTPGNLPPMTPQVKAIIRKNWASQ